MLVRTRGMRRQSRCNLIGGGERMAQVSVTDRFAVAVNDGEESTSRSATTKFRHALTVLRFPRGASVDKGVYSPQRGGETVPPPKHPAICISWQRSYHLAIAD